MRLVVITIMLLVAVTLVVGQDKGIESSWASLDGTWSLNLKESSVSATPRMKKDMVWIISSSESELAIQMQMYPFRMNSRLTFMLTDHTLKLRPNLGGERDVVQSFSLGSKTKWAKNRLTREYRTKVTMTPDSIVHEWIEDVIEKYTLSKDGKRLTFECTSSGNNPQAMEDQIGRALFKLVFDRKD